MSVFDLDRAEELATVNPKANRNQLRQLDKALTALREAGVVGSPSYGIASPYEHGSARQHRTVTEDERGTLIPSH
jgi:hypothetical protein